MEFFIDLWNSPSRYPLIVLLCVLLLYIPGTIIYMQMKTIDSIKYLKKHPDAVKVIIMGTMKGNLTVLSVNNEPPSTFYEEKKLGFFLVPGENIIEVQYSWSRPGLLYKTVSTTVGPNKITVTVKKDKKYHISYKKNTNSYDFSEV